MKVKLPYNAVSYFILILAFLISAIVTVFLIKRMHPLKFEQLEQRNLERNAPSFFRDFNSDGFSEQYEIHNDLNRGIYYITFMTFQDAIIDQFNLAEKINPEQIFFGDYTGDGIEDCFVFTVWKDSLFLYGYDIGQKKPLFLRRFLMRIPYPHPHFKIASAQVYDLHKDFSPELIFTVHAGLSMHPRGLYIFDIARKKIVSKFENNASKEKFLIYDLNGDGADEIILLGKANGNGNRNAPYTDWKNWVFILDQNLNLIVPALSFGAYPSCLDMEPIEINGRRYVLISHYRAAPNYITKPFGFLLVDAKGHFARKIYFNDPDLVGYTLALLSQGTKQYIYLNSERGALLKFNTNLQVVKKVKRGYKGLKIQSVYDVDRDGNPDLITTNENGTQVYDRDLRLLGEIDIRGAFAIRQCGENALPEIGINSTKFFYRFKIMKNPFYGWIPGIFIGLFILLIGLLQLGNVLLMRILTFVSYFEFSIRKTSNAVVLIKPNGHLLYFNVRTQTLLNMRESLKKNMPVHVAFKEYPDILACFNKCMQTGQPQKKDLVVNKGNLSIKGEIHVLPFKTKFNFIYAYLLEIRDFTTPVLTERHRAWSRTVRKMAHDIKTPLGSVMLNVERIQQKIEDTAPDVLEITRDDFQMTLAEIKRIQEMTRHFLKFTNLEESNRQDVHLNEVIRNTIKHFEAYFNNGLQVEVNLERGDYTLLADAKQLEMAFQIFVENSIDAMNGKGKILISSVLTQNLTRQLRDELEIEIADNGPGIPPEIRDRIFEPFFTSKKDGTGMGLAIARKIINDHGGEVEVISKKHFGAVFRIVLPVKRGTV